MGCATGTMDRDRGCAIRLNVQLSRNLRRDDGWAVVCQGALPDPIYVQSARLTTSALLFVDLKLLQIANLLRRGIFGRAWQGEV